MAALTVYALSLNAVNAYHWVLFHRPSPPDSPYFEGIPLICCRLYAHFPGLHACQLTRVHAPVLYHL